MSADFLFFIALDDGLSAGDLASAGSEVRFALLRNGQSPSFAFCGGFSSPFDLAQTGTWIQALKHPTFMCLPLMF